ncbi:hypothetical protein ACOSP6_10965 [Tenacibaculum sp. MEBiC06402]|uniref:hypothetical protein n=1 Tax=unclassified Tenacibaculum TaxID=2635139 RepID=UPI003B9ABEEE
MKSEEKSYVSTKKDLFRLYHKLPDVFMRETINDIISKCRKMDLDKVKYVKTITPVEFKLFVQEVGEM